MKDDGDPRSPWLPMTNETTIISVSETSHIRSPWLPLCKRNTTPSPSEMHSRGLVSKEFTPSHDKQSHDKITVRNARLVRAAINTARIPRLPIAKTTYVPKVGLSTKPLYIEFLALLFSHVVCSKLGPLRAWVHVTTNWLGIAFCLKTLNDLEQSP